MQSYGVVPLLGFWFVNEAMDESIGMLALKRKEINFSCFIQVKRRVE